MAGAANASSKWLRRDLGVLHDPLVTGRIAGAHEPEPTPLDLIEYMFDSESMAAVPTQLRELVPEQPVEELLPVLPVLSRLLQGGGLRRGCIVAVERSGLLCMTLAAGVSAAGGWCAVVGMPQLGVLAAADAGVDVDRLLLVPDPGSRWPQVVAALLEGCELVLLRPPARPSAQVARRLAAHARRSGGALVVAGGWEGANLSLRVTRSHWFGIGIGHGRLRGRRVQVVAGGRGGGARPRAQWWWLPGPNGAVAVAEQDVAERDVVAQEAAMPDAAMPDAAMPDAAVPGAAVRGVGVRGVGVRDAAAGAAGAAGLELVAVGQG